MLFVIRMRNWWRSWIDSVQDEAGQDLLEYGLLAALIAIFAVGAITAVGNQINTVLWEAIAAASF